MLPELGTFSPPEIFPTPRTPEIRTYYKLFRETTILPTLKSQTNLITNSGSGLSSCVTLGKCLPISEPLVPLLSKRNRERSPLRELRRIK